MNSLQIDGNKFRQLPAVIYKLSELQLLSLKWSEDLTRIEKDILNLTKLETLNCDFCPSLKEPPYAVRDQGLDAIKKYFTDLASAEGIEVTSVPVSLLGNFGAGKSSIKESILRGNRYLTKREERSLVDEATKVFQIDGLSLESSNVKLIDHGGHEIYHITYQLCMRERCIPVLVVNIEQFAQISDRNGPKEAARRVCFDWLSHFYLGSPDLGSPLLILTHTDKLSADFVVESRRQLIDAVEGIRRDLLKEESQCSGQIESSLGAVKHLSNKSIPIFSPEDIFEFSNDLKVTCNIEALKKNLDCRCREFNRKLPRLWEMVGKFIDDQTDKPYLTVSEITTQFGEDSKIILRYMHNSGRIFWFENVQELSGYIFHKIPVITSMISLLLHHCSEEAWKQRLDSFTSFSYHQNVINRSAFELLVDDFIETGVLNEKVLLYLLNEESKVPFSIAVQLLKSFYILHGSVTHRKENAYILPYFSQTYMDSSWKADGELQLRLDIMFRGLPLPRYVFQMMTVVILNNTLGQHDEFNVFKNGVTVEHDGHATHFLHDYNNMKVTLQVSTPLELYEKSWKHLQETSKKILDLLPKVWTASRTEVVVYCTHCLFLRHPNPWSDVNPEWLSDIHMYKSATSWTTYSSKNVSCRRSGCNNSGKARKLTVPKPFRIPCKL